MFLSPMPYIYYYSGIMLYAFLHTYVYIMSKIMQCMPKLHRHQKRQELKGPIFQKLPISSLRFNSS